MRRSFKGRGLTAKKSNRETSQTVLVPRWDYDKSVAKMRPLVFRWKNVTEEMLQELRRARDELKSQGARTDLVTNDTKLRTWTNYLEDVGLDRMTVHRWLDSSHNALLPNESQGSYNSEWYTSPEYIEAAKDVMGGIDLDPASSERANEVVKAKRFYGIKENGLTRKWKGRVWLNRPYASDLMHLFIEKLVASLGNGIEEAIVLVNNATEVPWFQLMPCSAICFPAGRMQFWKDNGETSSPQKGQAILYFGPNKKRFVDRFRQFGKTFYAA